MRKEAAKCRQDRSKGGMPTQETVEHLEIDAGDEVESTIERGLEIYQQAAREYKNALRRLAR